MQSQPNDSTKSQSAVHNGGIMTNSEALHALKDDSEAIRFVGIHKRVINHCELTI